MFRLIIYLPRLDPCFMFSRIAFSSVSSLTDVCKTELGCRPDRSQVVRI